jgi:hypothetical protein
MTIIFTIGDYYIKRTEKSFFICYSSGGLNDYGCIDETCVFATDTERKAMNRLNKIAKCSGLL